MQVHKLFLCSLVPVWVVSVAAGSEMTLPELIDRHTEARGGQEAIEAVQSLEIDLHIAEPTFEVRGLYRADRQERMRIDIFAGTDRVFSEGFNGSAGWQWNGGEEHAESIDGEAAAALRHGAILNLRGLHELQALGHGVSYLGLEDLDGVELHAVEITLDDGFKRYDYLDPDSFLIVRSRTFRAFHPDLDPEKKWHETRFSDFRDIEGQIRAFAQQTVNLETGETISTVTTEAIRVNVSLVGELFEAP